MHVLVNDSNFHMHHQSPYFHLVDHFLLAVDNNSMIHYVDADELLLVAVVVVAVFVCSSFIMPIPEDPCPARVSAGRTASTSR